MERILVSMNGNSVPREALSRSLALAKRIGARVFILSVLPVGRQDAGMDPEVRRKLDHLMKDASEDGVHVDSFVTEGSYEHEVINFVEQHRITLLVTEHSNTESVHADTEWASLQMIRHRISCRFEIVTPRRMETKEDGI